MVFSGFLHRHIIEQQQNQKKDEQHSYPTRKPNNLNRIAKIAGITFAWEF